MEDGGRDHKTLDLGDGNPLIFSSEPPGSTQSSSEKSSLGNSFLQGAGLGADDDMIETTNEDDGDVLNGDNVDMNIVSSILQMQNVVNENKGSAFLEKASPVGIIFVIL